jgi:hypothetical protein
MSDIIDPRTKLLASILTDNGLPVTPPDEASLDDLELERWNVCVEIVQRFESLQPKRRWLGWAIERPGLRLYVEYGGNEDDAWRHTLGWASASEIQEAKRNGARAFRVHITEVGKQIDV